MSNLAACPLCDKQLRVPEGGDGRRVRCPGCSEYLEIHEESEGMTLIALCSACGAERAPKDGFCPGCGAAMGEQEEAEEQTPVRVTRRRKNYAERSRARNVRKASTWVMVVAVLFALSGLIMGMIAMGDAEEARRALRGYIDSEVFQLEDGALLTAAELHQQIDLEVTLSFAIPFGLALAMLACWWWSRRSALPALITALCLYLAVLVVNAVIDPRTLVAGIWIKVLFVGGLSSGVRAALKQRAAEADD